MGRLTIDVPEGTHHDIRVLAATRGVSIREYILERIMPDVNALAAAEPSLEQMAQAWEERRQGFKLERGSRSWSQVTHAGHKW